MRLPTPKTSFRLRLLVASATVQVVLLSMLLLNSMHLMDSATEASVGVMIDQNASMLNALATAYGEQNAYAALQDVLDELLTDANEGLIYVLITRADGSTLIDAGIRAPHPVMMRIFLNSRGPTPAFYTLSIHSCCKTTRSDNYVLGSLPPHSQTPASRL